jgi:hypothetical protein
MSDDLDLEEKKPGVSRRTVAKAMAWSVPAVALAVPAPAYAASPCTPVPSFGGQSCKCPGGSTGVKFGYILQICVTVGNQCALPPGGLVATITGIVNNSNKPLTPLTPGVSYPFNIPVTVAPNCGGTAILFDSESSASTLIVSYTIGGGPTQTISLPAPPECAENCSGPA